MTLERHKQDSLYSIPWLCPHFPMSTLLHWIKYFVNFHLDCFNLKKDRIPNCNLCEMDPSIENRNLLFRYCWHTVSIVFLFQLIAWKIVCSRACVRVCVHMSRTVCGIEWPCGSMLWYTMWKLYNKRKSIEDKCEMQTLCVIKFERNTFAEHMKLMKNVICTSI